MAEIGLQRTRVVPVISELVTAGVAQHVGMSLDLQARALRGGRDDARKAGGGEWTAAFGSHPQRSLHVGARHRPIASAPHDRTSTHRAPFAIGSPSRYPGQIRRAMIVDREAGLTHLGRCGLPPVRLVVENTRSWEWESLPRREPKPPRERLGPLKSRKALAKR